MKKRQEIYDLYWYFAWERQNIFCELDKYCRVKVPELKSNRIKIKKKYASKKEKIEYMYPSKWRVTSFPNINTDISN